jgi:hypothetical protein
MPWSCLLYDSSLCSNPDMSQKINERGELPTHSFPLKEEQYSQQIRDCDSGVVWFIGQIVVHASACSMAGPGSMPVPAGPSGAGGG